MAFQFAANLSKRALVLPVNHTSMKPLLTALLLLIGSNSFAQRMLELQVRDRQTNEAVPGASVLLPKLGGRATNDSGYIKLAPGVTPNGTVLRITATGYTPQTYTVGDSSVGLIFILLDHRKTEGEAVVIVSSTRTESRIENLPTRVEVLGSEEVDVETGIKPGNIGSLLGDVAGIQAQQASAVTGNTEMRVQGLPGKYTQLLRDGMPLFGAFAGSFSILQIPPLDLKQIEIIKGSSSTLYGGGAIAGMINIIPRRPVEGRPEHSVLLNASSLGETNLNVWLSNRRGHTGYTFFAGANNQVQQDVDGDGFSDIARSQSINLHPVFYFYPNAKHTFSIGYNGNWEERNGGDMQVLRDRIDAEHAFFIHNRLGRQSGDVQWEYRISTDKRLTLKAIGSWFNRNINTNTYQVPIAAGQLSYYSELSYLEKHTKHDLVAGINVNGQDFHSDQLNFPKESYSTLGFFLQDDWRIHPKWTVESGLRADVNSRFGTMLLPRLSVLYRINTDWTSRIGGGFGYRVPSAFDNEVEERDYYAITDHTTRAERSAGANWDVNFHKRLDEVDLTVNQSFFYTSVRNVAELLTNRGTPQLWTMPEDEPLRTAGLETYVQLRVDELEAYLGYTYTDAKRNFNPGQPRQPLVARDKFAALISCEFSERFRAGIEASHIGRQYLEDGTRTPGYLIAAAMLRYDWKVFSFVLNCENLFDYRQSRKEALIQPYSSLQNPWFRELWAPIDGRVVNLSMRIRW
jgi:outer membrane receptor for ferrienterochelin and colicins